MSAIALSTELVDQAQAGSVSPDLIRARIAVLVETADRMLAEYYQRCGYSLPPDTHEAQYCSDKWCKIVTKRPDGVGLSVYCFVALQDSYTKALGSIRAGDIHKPAGWKAPARHARGNVLRDDFTNALTPTGIVYLR